MACNPPSQIYGVSGRFRPNSSHQHHLYHFSIPWYCPTAPSLGCFGMSWEHSSTDIFRLVASGSWQHHIFHEYLSQKSVDFNKTWPERQSSDSWANWDLDIEILELGGWFASQNTGFAMKMANCGTISLPSRSFMMPNNLLGLRIWCLGHSFTRGHCYGIQARFC